MATRSRLRVVRMTPETMLQELREWESKFGMTSEEFLRRFDSGEMGDSRDAIQWAGACGMAIEMGVLAAAVPNR